MITDPFLFSSIHFVKYVAEGAVAEIAVAAGIVAANAVAVGAVAVSAVVSCAVAEGDVVFRSCCCECCSFRELSL